MKKQSKKTGTGATSKGAKSAKSAGLTRESVLAAIADGAKTLSDVARKHGYVGNVSGDVTKKIRTLVPDVADRLAGKVVEVVEKPVSVGQRKTSKTEKTGYTGGVYGKIFQSAVGLGSRGEMSRQEAISAIVAETGLNETQVVNAMRVFTTPNHQSNQNRSRNAATKRGFVLLVPMTAAEGVPAEQAPAEQAPVADPVVAPVAG